MKNSATHTRTISATAIFCTIFGALGMVQAQPAAYPSKPIRIVVPFTPGGGTAPAITDLMGGQIQLLFTGAPAVMSQLKNGQLRALAVSSPQRLDALPDVPTVAESGYKGFEADQWYGVVAPAGTPREIVAKLNEQINQALNAPALKSRLTAEGAVATPSTPEVFGKLIETEIGRWKPVIGSGRVRAD